jgi:hypothetical protein
LLALLAELTVGHRDAKAKINRETYRGKFSATAKCLEFCRKSANFAPRLGINSEL